MKRLLVLGLALLANLNSGLAPQAHAADDTGSLLGTWTGNYVQDDGLFFLVTLTLNVDSNNAIVGSWEHTTPDGLYAQQFQLLPISAAADGWFDISLAKLEIGTPEPRGEFWCVKKGGNDSGSFHWATVQLSPDQQTMTGHTTRTDCGVVAAPDRDGPAVHPHSGILELTRSTPQPASALAGNWTGRLQSQLANRSGPDRFAWPVDLTVNSDSNNLTGTWHWRGPGPTDCNTCATPTFPQGWRASTLLDWDGTVNYAGTDFSQYSQDFDFSATLTGNVLEVTFTNFVGGTPDPPPNLGWCFTDNSGLPAHVAWFLLSPDQQIMYGLFDYQGPVQWQAANPGANNNRGDLCALTFLSPVTPLDLRSRSGILLTKS